MNSARDIKHFYIPEEQSIYLLSHADAKKLKDWVALCTHQLERLGYSNITLLGKGAFGFAFSGVSPTNQQLVFKFARLNLSQHVRDRLEEEAFMQSQVDHPRVPKVIDFQHVGKQPILVMTLAPGIDLEKLSLRLGPLPPELVVKIAVQLGELLLKLRVNSHKDIIKPVVHGDIKPSNLVWNEESQQVELIDWGSSVFAQLDENGQVTGNNVMDLMSQSMHSTNARLGDVYFIGEAQLNGELSSPRFDEQGLASTLYALASGQSCRYGSKVITPSSLGLPKMLASILTYMLSDDVKKREQGADYFFNHLHVLKNLVFREGRRNDYNASIPTWVSQSTRDIETVVYSSRKSYLRNNGNDQQPQFYDINDVQFDRYYKNYLQGMGDTEKAFVSGISRLGRYPVVGGIAIRWAPEGIYVDSSLNLYNKTLQEAFELSVNNVISLAAALHKTGVFKCCMFNAKNTLHIERTDVSQPFIPDKDCVIPFERSVSSVATEESRLHSYFEDGEDPDELLVLPDALMQHIHNLNKIHHTGCIIFEALPTHLKIHNYFTLLDHSKAEEFEQCLVSIVGLIPTIKGLGISGFMKLPYKDTRFFEHSATRPEKYYPRNPNAELMEQSHE